MSRKTLVGVTLLSGSALVLGWPFRAFIAWTRYGREPRRPGQSPLLDSLLPAYDVSERHETRVAAPASLTYRVAKSTGLDETAIVRSIIRAREIMMRINDHVPLPPGGVVAQMCAMGWSVLAEKPDRTIVLGTVTQPWRGNVEFRPLSSEEFIAFNRAGYVKIVSSISVEQIGDARSVLRVETRVATTDPTARAKFRRYWSVFLPGIDLIRRAALRVVKREAERRHRDAVRALAPRSAHRPSVATN